ncbi:ArsR/SmtB family transcription factor [Sphingomonas aerophila]|uniref:ArsR family transcriptional regulator n=1 Tax=Sphingomonas aerophila TaxID=1344948 RepID=A0A7W9BFM4_9SPHN|nr:metalloregulator ArsR/SmtB family transcription factor [Sphingomonas aerophila]MBB5715991.1 ArsR family transcriptional regulator [Sphingomonas aerophila]
MASALDIFRALADATRLRIVTLVRSMELSVGELAQVLGQSQPRVSRHVKILEDAGLVQRRREGSWVFVALGARHVIGPITDSLDAWGGDHWTVADAARLAAVRADREANAAAWFEARAENWDAIRSLHVAESEVEAAMADMLGDAPVGTLIDIGTGTGRMLELFGGHADAAFGIDRSSEMLRLARAKLGGRAELRQADLYALPLADGAADVAILHHVLHFAEAPALALAEAGRVLGRGGRLLIADFAPHDREDLRTKDAHVRLGFADDQIEGWFAGAGLVPAGNQTLKGGELTVKLWMGRKAASGQGQQGRRLRAVGVAA